MTGWPGGQRCPRPKAIEGYKGYDSYQRETSRQIPMVILTAVA